MTIREVILQFGRPYKWSVLLGALLLLATNGLAMVIPWQMKRAVDTLQTSTAENPVFLQAILILLAAAVLQALIRVASRQVVFGVGRRVENDIRGDLFQFLLRQEPRYYESQSVGDLMSRLANDINAIRMFFGFALLNVINTAFALSMSLSFMLAISPWLTMWSMCMIPVLMLLMRRFSKLLHDRFLDVQTRLGNFSSFLQEGMGGLELIQMFGAQKNFGEAFEVHNRDYFEANLDLARVRSLMTPIMVFIAGFGGLVVLLVGGLEVMEGTMTLGDFVAFQGYLAILVWPIMVFGWLFNTLQRGLAALRRMNEIMQDPVELAPQEELGAMVKDRPVLEVREYCTIVGGSDSAQQRAEFALGPISFSVQPGCWFGVTGPTGSGKSVLMQLLLWYVVPQSGTLHYHGAAVNEHTIQAWRQALAYVPTAPLMFSGTIRENLQVVSEGSLEESVLLEALHTACFDEDLARFPEGLDTMIGEKGVTLSGGQRQRMGIARALLLQRPVLVLDDALSAVDADTEDRLCQRLRAQYQGTVVLATHRMSLLSLCNEVMTLQAGRQKEIGAPDALLQSGGLFAKLHATMHLEKQLEEMAP